MLKLSKKHEIYEVWNEFAAESVFVDHKPTLDELKELVKKNDWIIVGHTGLCITLFIAKYIHVERLQHFYTAAPARAKKSKPVSCQYCLDSGWKSDDSYSTFPCPHCQKL